MSSQSSGINNLPHSLQALVRKEVAGELIRWVGMSPAGRMFLYSTPVWLMGIPWLAFSLFWEATVIGGLFGLKGAPRGMPSGMGWVMALFGLPFIAIGIGMVLAPFWAARKARHTAYVLTDKRLLTITAGRSTTVRSVDPRRIVAVEYTKRTDGSGNIDLTLGFARDSDGDTVTKSERLWAVPDVVRLETMLRDAGKP